MGLNRVEGNALNEIATYANQVGKECYEDLQVVARGFKTLMSSEKGFDEAPAAIIEQVHKFSDDFLKCADEFDRVFTKINNACIALYNNTQATNQRSRNAQDAIDAGARSARAAAEQAKEKGIKG